MEAKSTKDDYSHVKEDLRLLREDLAKLTKTVAEGQRSNISNLRDEIRQESKEALDQVRQRSDEAIARAKDAGNNAVQGVEHQIEERPFLSIIIIFLAGILVGKLLNR